MEVVNALKYAAILMKENISICATFTSFPSKSTIGNSTGLDCPHSCLLSSETININKYLSFSFWMDTYNFYMGGGFNHFRHDQIITIYLVHQSVSSFALKSSLSYD